MIVVYLMYHRRTQTVLYIQLSKYVGQKCPIKNFVQQQYLYQYNLKVQTPTPPYEKHENNLSCTIRSECNDGGEHVKIVIN